MVPLDGSTFAEQALPHAVDLAKRSRARIHLAVVHEPMPTWVPSAVQGAAVDPGARTGERAYLDGIKGRLTAETSLEIDTALLDAPSASTLAEYAVKQGFSTEWLDRPVAAALSAYAAKQLIDLIVLATHGRGPLTRSWFGGVADQVVRHVHMPVLFIRPVKEGAAPRLPPYRHVLIPLDGSPFSEAVLDHAITLGALSGARFTLLHMVEDTLPAPGLSELAPAEDFPAIDDAPWREQAESYLEQRAALFRAKRIPVDIAAVLGVSPAALILEEARNRDVDLIALTTHGSRGLRRMLLGSVTSRVIRGADTPVLVFRPAAPGR